MEMAVIEKHEIRKGDHIRVDFKELDGIKQTRVGVADNQDPEGDWRAQEFGFLTWVSRAARIDQIYLVDRPLPPLPTGPGTVFRATKIRGIETSVIVFVRYGNLVGIPIYVSANRVMGLAEHAPHHITAWEPIEVTA